ncbi:Alpha/Beta hydrolase protein [Cercophora newfieldiana]|uniref:Alpha/Beta hydrolase protein n=1 Tax=Cercophora newfieldiana TaxID=92897 RepID=A0AA40CSZ1_9PEZI|nr:Alpha/Beta hydrolase protein [Cercophora newfieldiana]
MSASKPLRDREAPQLSLAAKVRFISYMVFLAPPQILFNVVRSLCLATARGIPLRYFANSAFCRFSLEKIAPLEIQFTIPSTAKLYASWIKSRAKSADSKRNDVVEQYAASRLKHDVEALPDGASSLLWVGDRSRATKFVYFFHGGGYISPLQPGHLEWCLRAYVAAAAEQPGEEVAVAVLQYTLCPAAQYPTQLAQAAAGLAHLLASGVRPRDSVIGGDSAGGNLTAQLLGHLLHPHPAAEKITLSEPLAGAFLVSPVVSRRTDYKSFVDNGSIDMLCPAIIRKTCDGVLGGVASYEAEVNEGKSWAMPLDGDAEAWFTGLKDVVRAVYVTAGAQECLLDQSVEVAECIRKGNPGLDVRLEVSKNEAHDWILMEGEAKADGDATRRMRAWATSALWA